MALPSSAHSAKASSGQTSGFSAQTSGHRAPHNGASDILPVGEAAFYKALENVIVESPTEFDFKGCVERKYAKAFWVWLCRDVLPSLATDVEILIQSGQKPNAVIDTFASTICNKVDVVLLDAGVNTDASRRLNVQMGGDAMRDHLHTILLCLRSRALIEKACAFGKATNALQDENALGTALRSLPSKDPIMLGLLMHTIVGQTSNPSNLVSAIVTLIGSSKEAQIRAAGFDALIDAILAHTQNQVLIASINFGAFADVDLICRCLNRFHKLMRAINAYIEFDRSSHWGFICTQLTRTISGKVEPRLREVSADVSQSLRKARTGADVLDSDRLLAALNGMYLLTTIRDARESLAMNALFDKAWTETGQMLEILVARNLEEFRANRIDPIAEQRLDFGIKMAELRFGSNYADILRKARSAALRLSAG